MELIVCSVLSGCINWKYHQVLANLTAAPKLKVSTYAAPQIFVIVSGVPL
jgi:hypothetical protein